MAEPIPEAGSREESEAPPALECEDVAQEFRVPRRGHVTKARVSAVAGVSFRVRKGETYAIVGETGSGKTTLARSIIGAPPPSAGRIAVAGRPLGTRGRGAARERGRLVQMVFQDPVSALDPKWSVERIVAEPLLIAEGVGRKARRTRAHEMLSLVGLPPGGFAERRVRELSGGQAQRVAIARALVSAPTLVICDEPVTALDVATQAQVLRLLSTLKEQLALTYLLIAHDLAVVRALADDVGTMYLGKICETAPTESLFEHPAHPYTEALLSAIPTRSSGGPGDQAGSRPRIRLLGSPPSPIDPPSGCRFHTRCSYAQDVCARHEPPLRPIGPARSVACHFPLLSTPQRAG